MSTPPDRPPRLAHLDVGSFSFERFTNGATIQYRDMLRRARSAGWDCAVLTVGPREDSRWAGSEGEEIEPVWHFDQGIAVGEYLLRGRPGADPQGYRRALRRCLDDFAPDLVVVNVPPARLEEAEVAMFEALAEGAADWVCFVPDMLFPRADSGYGERYARLRTTLERARLVAPSRFLADAAETSLGSCEIFANVFTTNEILAQERTGGAITFVNPHPMKGAAIAGAVARLLPHRRFQFVEGWPYPPGYDASGLPNVTVVPYARDLRAVWRNSDLLIAPSLCHEGFGRVVVEAQLNSIPVIAHRIGGLPEAAGRDAAILLDPPEISGDPVFPEVASDAIEAAAARFAGAIETLLDDPAAHAALAERGRISALAHLEAGESCVHALLRPYAVPAEQESLLIVSPHADDAAFSLGGLIAGLSGVAVVTLFGRSNYALPIGFSDDCEGITRVRRAEDKRFCRPRGIALEYWDEPEASLRWGADYDAVFAAPGEEALAVRADQAVCGAIADRFAALIAARRPRLVALPGGLGGHRDHLVARAAGELAAARAKVPVAYYEDLPYAAALAEDELRRAIRAGGLELAVNYFPIAETMDAKLDGMRGYASQVHAEVIAQTQAHAQRWAESSERLWSAVPIAPMLAPVA
ncbi:MAG: glycosyltransferase [Sphingomonas sp.]